MSNQDGPYIQYTEDGLFKTTGQLEGDKFIFDKDPITADDSLEVKSPIPGQHFNITLRDTYSIDQHIFEKPNTIFAISDIEGDFDFFYSMLLAHNVIDEAYNWTFGDGHLVVLGDIFDRGPHVTEVLWLIYRLEQLSEKVGGHVHLVLGNHESMTLTGDDRYVHKKYHKVSASLGVAYRELFNQQSALGKWLRTKNAMIKLGDYLFVHAGVSPDFASEELSLNESNDIIRSALNKNDISEWGYLEKILMGSDGPLWYRDMVYEKISTEQVDSIINQFDIKQIVVGHTVVPKVQKMLNDKIIAIDVNRRSNKNYEALLIQNGLPLRVLSDGSKHPL